MGWRLRVLSDRGPGCRARLATSVLLLATVSLQGCGSTSVDADGSVGTGGVTSSGGASGGTTGSGGATGGTTGSGGATGGITGSGASSGSGGETNAVDDYEVLVNPYGNAALVAVINVPGLEASDVATVEVVVSGQNGAPDLAREYVPTD